MDKDKKVFIASFSSTKPDLLLANFFANTEMLVQPNWYNSFVIDTNALPIGIRELTLAKSALQQKEMTLYQYQQILVSLPLLLL